MTASVFKAHDQQLRELVALKVLNPINTCIDSNLDVSKDFFDNEIRALEKLPPHENIVEIIDYGLSKFEWAGSKSDTGDCQFIALKYIDGVELIDFLSCKGALPESIARHIFKQVSSALIHIHKSNFVHRDLKSDNIIISAGCKPHIIDFGFASSKKGELENGMFTSRVGTPGYMAPEIIEGSSQYCGESADLFALAVVLFQMVMGRPPFEKADRNDFLFKSIVQGRIDIFWRTHLRALPKGFIVCDSFKDLVTKMLQADPGQRPSFE